MNEIEKRLVDAEDWVEIEGLVFRTPDSQGWFAGLSSSDGRICLCQIDYCPFCGEKILGKTNHKCG